MAICWQSHWTTNGEQAVHKMTDLAFGPLRKVQTIKSSAPTELEEVAGTWRIGVGNGAWANGVLIKVALGKTKFTNFLATLRVRQTAMQR